MREVDGTGRKNMFLTEEPPTGAEGRSVLAALASGRGRALRLGVELGLAPWALSDLKTTGLGRSPGFCKIVS